jgi:universal stress protein E
MRNILYYWDGGPAASAGLQRAWTLARNCGAALTVAGVLDKLPKELLRLAPSQGISRLAELAAGEMRERILRAIAQLGCPPRLAQIKVLEGRMPERLLGEVEEGGYGLVVVNAPRRGVFRNWFSKDVPLSLMRACPVPVMGFRGGDRPRAGRILAAVNAAASSCSGASLSRAVVDWAADLAWAEGAQLHVLYCWNLAGEELLTSRGGLPRRRYLQMLLRERRQARTALRALMDQCNLSGLDVVVHLQKGEAGESIPELAAVLQADLLVMGMPARPGIRRFFFGSLAEDVMRAVDCPIVAVPTGGCERPERRRAA